MTPDKRHIYPPRRIYRFGDFTLDPAEHRLTRGQDEVPLPPKAFKTLVYLVERQGHLVKKNELLDALWADVVVTENALTKRIKELRQALGDDRDQPRYIQTVPWVGYKFVAEVEEFPAADVAEEEEEEYTAVKVVESEEGAEEPKFEDGAPGIADRSRGSPSAVLRPSSSITEDRLHHRFSIFQLRSSILGLLVVVALVGSLIVVYRFWSHSTGQPPPIKTIAVLPFKPLSADRSDEYMGLGMADTLITKLSTLHRLIVRPTSAVLKYAGVGHDTLAAGREQQVDAVLEGSIQRSGEKLRVTVRLLDVKDGRPLWAYQCDEQQCTDLFAMQDAISQQVAGALLLKLTGEQRKRLTKRYTGNTEAYELYLRGRYFWNKRTEDGLKKGIEYFTQALERDPSYALAYVGLADCYGQLSYYSGLPPKETFPKAKAAATKAL